VHYFKHADEFLNTREQIVLLETRNHRESTNENGLHSVTRRIEPTTSVIFGMNVLFNREMFRCRQEKQATRNTVNIVTVGV
jgi:hypothetical protein